MSCVHSIYNLKLSRIWNKFFKTAHEIKVLVQRKTGNRPVMEVKTREVFWTACGDKDANPFPSCFSWPGGTHVQTGAGQEVSALQNAAEALPHSLLLGHIPPALSMLLIPGVRVGATPYHLREKRWAGPSSPAFHASKIFSWEWPPQSELEREDRFLGWLPP